MCVKFHRYFNSIPDDIIFKTILTELEFHPTRNNIIVNSLTELVGDDHWRTPSFHSVERRAFRSIGCTGPVLSYKLQVQVTCKNTCTSTQSKAKLM